jgi:hypothetical protein
MKRQEKEDLMEVHVETKHCFLFIHHNKIRDEVTDNRGRKARLPATALVLPVLPVVLHHPSLRRKIKNNE